MKHLVVIDGLNFLFRAYHAVRPLTRSDGLHTNALYGLAQMLIKVVRDLQPDMCVVALDSIHKSFRKDLYAEYKANRTEMDPEMAEQMHLFEPMIESFGLYPLRFEGFEADDLIATLASQYGGDHKVTIVSSDKDLMQLLGGNVEMLDTMKSKQIGPEEVFDKFGVGPEKVTQVQALIGDSSDNIPGVYGVGPKTAAKLIEEYGDLDGIYANIDNITQKKLKERLLEHKDQAYLSYQLVCLKRDVEIAKDVDYSFHPTIDKAVDFLLSLEFKTLASRLAGNGFKQKAAVPELKGSTHEMPDVAENGHKGQYEAVTTSEKLQAWVKRLEKSPCFGFDTETTSLHVMQADLVGISLSDKIGHGCYIPLTHQGDMLSSPTQLPKDEVLAALKPLLEDGNKPKVAHNLKYDYLMLLKEGVEVRGSHDTMLMSFCLDGGKNNHGLDDLAKRHLDIKTIPYKEVCGTGVKQIGFQEVPIEQATDYAAEDADIALRLYDLFHSRLQQEKGPLAVYRDIELPLVPTIARMEKAGVKVDKSELAQLSQTFAKGMAEHEKKIFQIADTEFNVNSPKQLGEVLFDKLGLEGGRKTKTGWSTNEEVLRKLADNGHDIAEEVLSYRSLAKLKSTYADALVEQINPRTGRVHTSYNQTGAATGRFSSSDPNLQNIPIRSENGRRIRHAFIPSEGSVFLSADYSQVELRLLAHMADIPALKEAFAQDKDIHAYTAHKIFDVDIDKVDSEQRRAAKIINFGIVYGMGPYALAKQLGVENSKAKTYIENYFNRYEGMREFMEASQKAAHKHGYVETLYKRRVHLPNIHSSNKGLVAGAERAAINAPLQGSNADIMKLVMPKVEKALQDKNLKTTMLMQVHDELIFEIPESELDQAREIITREMEQAITLSVPLKVGVGIGKTWEDAH